MSPARIVGLVCEEPDCSRPQWADGLCSPHWHLKTAVGWSPPEEDEAWVDLVERLRAA